MKKLLVFFTLILLSSCVNQSQKEIIKSAKHQAASDRINSTNQNSENLFNEMDQ